MRRVGPERIFSSLARYEIKQQFECDAHNKHPLDARRATTTLPPPAATAPRPVPNDKRARFCVSLIDSLGRIEPPRSGRTRRRAPAGPPTRARTRRSRGQDRKAKKLQKKKTAPGTGTRSARPPPSAVLDDATITVAIIIRRRSNTITLLSTR